MEQKKKEPGNVGSVLLSLQKGSDGPLRMINILDDESDEEAPEVLPKVSAEAKDGEDDDELAEEGAIDCEEEAPFVAFDDAPGKEVSEEPRDIHLSIPPVDEGAGRNEVHKMTIAPVVEGEGKLSELDVATMVSELGELLGLVFGRGDIRPE